MAKVKSYKKQNGQRAYMVSGYLGIDPRTGASKSTTLRGFETRQDAKDAFETAVYEFKHGIDTAPQAKRMRIQDAYDEWWPLYRENVEPSTEHNRRELFKLYILPAFGDWYMDAITPIDAQKWLNGYVKTHATYVNTVSAIKMLYKFAMRMEWVDRDPFALIQRPRHVMQNTRSVKNNHYSVEEAQRFIAALDQMFDEHDGMYGRWALRRAYLLIVLYTGMRRGEACALRWSDISFEDSTINVERTLKGSDRGTVIGKTKTQSSRRLLHLDGLALDTLRTWHTIQAKQNDMLGRKIVSIDSWVFPQELRPDKPITLSSTNNWMRRLCEAKGLRYITIHGLRHTKATIMAEAGVSINDIAAILGHTDASFTLREYIHSTQAGLNNAEQAYIRALKS